MAIVKNVFRRKKLSDAGDDQGTGSDEDDTFMDEIRGQDAEGDEGQNAETSLTSEFIVVGELKNPVTSDREHSPAEGLIRPHSSSKLARKSRRTLRVDAMEDQHAHEETEKTRNLHSTSKRGGIMSQATPSVPVKDDEQEEFGFEIEISIPAEPAREVLRRSSSRERGRRSRSSSRDAMRQVRERSRQRRTERASKDILDPSHCPGERIDPVSGVASPMHAAMNPDSSNVHTNAQDGIQTSEKKSRSPRPGTRSRSSERPFGSKRESVPTGQAAHTDSGKSIETSQGQAVDRTKSNPSSLSRQRASSREGRRSRREKESTEGVPMNSNEKDSATARTGLSADVGVDQCLRHENAEASTDLQPKEERGESAKAAKEASIQNEKRSQHRSSSRDIIRSKRNDSKERTRRSRADSKERTLGSRSSSKDRLGHGRSRSREGLSFRVSKGYSEKGEENTGRVHQGRDRSEDVSSFNNEKSPLNSEKHESCSSESFPRRNSRENINQLKSQQAITELHEIKTRIPRRNSREDALRQQTLEHTERKHESLLQAETSNCRDDPHLHQPTSQMSDGSAPRHKSPRQMVRRNSQEDSPRKAAQLVGDEIPQKSESTSRDTRQRSRERRSRRSRIQNSDDKAATVPNVETSPQDDSLLLKDVDEERTATEMMETVETIVPRALPEVIIHEEVEKQMLEARKRIGHVERYIEVNPAMALLNHLGIGDTVVPANESHVEQQPVFTEEVLDGQSVNVVNDTKPEVADLPEEGNESMNERASQPHETLKADETNEEPEGDSLMAEKKTNVLSTNMDLGIQHNVDNETNTAEFEAVGPNEPVSARKAERNTRKDITKSKRKNSMEMQGDQPKDSNPANDLLGFLGSNYDDLFAKNEETATPSASGPLLVDQPENSIDFFKAINYTGLHHQSGGDDCDRIERLVGSFDNVAVEEGARPLPPPSVAPIDESAKQKARLVRRLARQKKVAADESDVEPPSTLCPPSLAGDMPKLMHKSSVRKPKREASAPTTRGVARHHSDDGSTMEAMLNAQERPSKSTSSGRPKIRRAKSGDGFTDHMCEQSLAPPSLAPPSLAPRRMAPKTPEKEEEMPRKVTRREVRKATKFASLDEDEDDEDSVGIIVAASSPADMPKKRGGMLSKAQSAVNILEKTTRRVVKKAASTKNLFA